MHTFPQWSQRAYKYVKFLCFGMEFLWLCLIILDISCGWEVLIVCCCHCRTFWGPWRGTWKWSLAMKSLKTMVLKHVFQTLTVYFLWHRPWAITLQMHAGEWYGSLEEWAKAHGKNWRAERSYLRLGQKNIDLKITHRTGFGKQVWC